MSSERKGVPSNKGLVPLFDLADDHYNADERGLSNIEPAWAKAALFFRTGQRFGHRDRSSRGQVLVEIREQLDVYRSRFEHGDTLSLLHAVGICADENLPLPTWLAQAFRDALQSFLNVGGHDSLDAVFCSPTLPTDTPKKAAAARQDWQLGVQLWVDVWDAVMSDEAITSLDAALDAARATRDYGVGKTKARALVLMIENNQRELLRHPPSKHLSRFLEKRRKR